MAIAYDTFSEGGTGSGDSLIVSHTCASSLSGILVVGIVTRPSGGSSSDIVTSVTYNGVTMTRAISNAISTDRRQYIYYLLAPTSGANNIVVTTSGGGPNIQAKNTSYIGVKQGEQPDASTSPIQSATSPLTVSITTVINNCWMVTFADQNGNLTANTGCVRRTSLDIRAMFDSNTTLSVGVNSMIIDGAGGGQVNATAISISPLITTTVAVSDSSSITENPIKRARSYPVEIMTMVQVTLKSISDSLSLTDILRRIGIGFKNQSKNSISVTNQSKNTPTWTNLNKTNE